MEPLVVEIAVEAPVAHAFEVWTGRFHQWWPRSHTVAQSEELVFEPFAGGRIFERSVDGNEHDWGEVLEWEPPNRVSYLWHLFFDRTEATEVEVTFSPSDEGTQVRIRQTGWEKLGDAGPTRRARTGQAWQEVLGWFAEALGTGS